MEKELWLFIVKKNPCMRCSQPDTRPLKIAIHHNFFSLCCVQRWPRAWVKQYAGPHDLEGYLFCWIIQYIPLETLGGNLIWQEFAGGLKRPAVDKQSFNSWWSGPPRAEWSLLLKPLVQHRLSPCWLLMAEVLSDHLQTLLGFFVLFCLSFYSLVLLFFLFFMGLQKILGGTWGGYDRILTFPLHCALRFGWHPALSAFSRARSHLQQIPVSRARMHFAELDDCGWKMNYSAGLCLTDGASCDCTRVKEAIQKSSIWPCLNYLVVFPFVVRRLNHFYQYPWPTELVTSLAP